MKSLLALVACAAIGVAGCTTKTLDRPTTITTKPLPEVGPELLAKAKEVTGSSCSRLIFSLIPIAFATAEGAFKDALAQAPGTNTLLQYETRTNVVWAFLFYTEVCVEVHGYAISTADLAAVRTGGRPAAP